MRIGIDARLAGLKHGGIGRYTEELLRHLLALKTTHEWVVFLYEKGQLPWLEKKKSVKIVYVPIRHYSVAEQTKIPGIFLAEKLDLLHVPHFNVPLAYTKPYVVTIHDLLWHERKDKDATTLSPLIHGIKHRAYRFVSESAIRGARAVFVPTHHVEQMVKPYVKQGAVVVTPEGISEAYTVSGPQAKRSYRYLVYTGSLYPHKNVPYILDMLLGMQEMHLIVISGRSVFRTALHKQVKVRSLENRVHVEEGLEDREVAALYRGAVAMIMPSFSEGFGLPGLEAMACGLPLFASDIPVFHEVYGDAAVYISPHDPTTGIRALVTMMSHKEKEKERRAQMKQVVHQYSWKDMAKKTFDTYQAVLQSL